jgi:hypothetical protein
MMVSLPDSLIEEFANCLDRDSLQALANLKLSPDARERLDVLANKANEGALSSSERAEYHSFIERSEFLALAQLRARSRLGLPIVP